MPAKARKRGRPRSPQMQTFIFEIAEFEPEYLLSVDYDRHRTSPYRDHTTIRLDTVCIFPQPLAGRTAKVHVMAQRNFMEPDIFKSGPDWKPNCVAALSLPPTAGDFSFLVPAENMAFLLTAITHKTIRYVSLWGRHSNGARRFARRSI